MIRWWCLERNRIRDDETLAEEIVFELGPNGEVLRFVQHSNYSERIR